MEKSPRPATQFCPHAPPPLSYAARPAATAFSFTACAVVADHVGHVLDSPLWRYTILGALVVELVGQGIVLLELASQLHVWATSPCVFLTTLDVISQHRVYRHVLCRSRLVFADAVLWMCMLIVWLSRLWTNDTLYEGQQAIASPTVVPLVYVAFAALRLVVFPRARHAAKALERQGPVANSRAADVVHSVTPRRHGGSIRQGTSLAPTHSPHGQECSRVPPVYMTSDVVLSTLSHWATQQCDFAWCVLVMLVNAAIHPVQAYCLQHVLDHAFPSTANRSSADRQIALHRGMAGLIALCVPFGLSTVGIGMLQSRMVARATARLHSRLLRVVLAQPATYFVHDAKVGDVTNVFASDVARVNALWQGVFWNLLHPAIVAAAGFGYLLTCDFHTGWLALWVAIVVVSSGPQGRAAANSTAFGAANADLTASFQDTLHGHATVVVYGMQPSIQAKFDANAQALSSIQFAKDLWATLVQIYVEGAMYMFVAVVTAGLATRVVSTHTMTPGEFVSFVALLGRISSPITVLGGFMRVAIGNSSSLQRVDALLALSIDAPPEDARSSPSSLPSNSSSTTTPSLQVALTVFQVTVLVSPAVTVVSDVSFTCRRGSVTCIVGPSGSGKTSVLRCLMQAGPLPASGSIWWDDALLSLAHQIHVGVVFQHPRFLQGTIRENLCYGHPTASDADCHDAIVMAHCLAFVHNLPMGIDTDMASVQWSGGQLQRLSLARALVRRPSVLLLDEATSALDQEAEAAVMATLTWLAKTNGTVIVAVTHRLTTTKMADHIVVLHAGRVVECGRHSDLMERRGVFYDLARANGAMDQSDYYMCDDASVTSEEGDHHDRGDDCQGSNHGDVYMVL